VVVLTSATWYGIRVCPIIALTVSECPGSVVRELNELAIWFKKVSESNPQGSHDVWMGLVAAMEECSTGAVTLGVMESCKVPLPSCIDMQSFVSCTTLCSNSSRPVVCSGLSKDKCGKLLSFLLNFDYENCRACFPPRFYLARATMSKTQSETCKQKVVHWGKQSWPQCDLF
jgi:hypothetical protein